MTISQAVKFLEDAFDVLNKEYFESSLSRPIIVIQSAPGINGHFYTAEVWQDTQRKCGSYEISMGAEALKRPIANVVATLVHEMVHYYCHLNGIQDTSRGGTYHNNTSNNLESVTAQYVDVRLNRKVVVLDTYHTAVFGPSC